MTVSCISLGAYLPESVAWMGRICRMDGELIQGNN